MIRILFVCFGNICRSPMAEYIFRNLAEKRGLSDCFAEASAATDMDLPNYPVYPPAGRKLAEHHIYPDEKRACQMQPEDYDRYDYLIGMERSNCRRIREISGGDPKHKVHRLLDYTRRPRDIVDPWYTDDFETAYRDILEGCEALLDALIRENHLPGRGRR